MATKIVISFAGPLTPTAIEGWLGQCKDGFSIYASTKTEKAPDLTVETKIRLTGTNMQEPTMAAWWNAGHMEFLRLESWETFEKQIRNRFMPKGYKMVALHTFFLCAQNRLPFLEYATALADAHNTLGPNIIMAAIYKYQLLFHAHPMLVLRIMAIPDFDLEDISFDNLVALMSMQWESLIMEIPATRSTLRTSPTAASIPPIPPMPRANEPRNQNPLSLTDREHLSTVGGCWRCRKVPTDSGWTPHVGRTCPGDPTQGVSPGPDFVPPTPPVIKREHMGAILLDADEYFAQGEDQPEDSDVRYEDTDSDATDWPGHPN
ncbi:hypothetical protein BU17DRAFT_100449 [Hysterangium stoloniferum]|nr:hypothetical protein BU17DRAFT_100449 [Hysterangium stoloniferum]